MLPIRILALALVVPLDAAASALPTSPTCPGAAEGDAYLAGVPPSAGIVAVVSDAPGLAASIRESTWFTFAESLMEVGWQEFLEEAAAELEAPSLARLPEVFEHVDAIAVYAPTDLGEEAVAGAVFVLRDGPEGLGPFFDALMPGGPSPLELSPGAPLLTESEQGFVALTLVGDSLLVWQTGGDRDAVATAAEEALQRMERGPGSGIDGDADFQLARERAVDSSQVEIFVAVGALIEGRAESSPPEPPFDEAIEELRWIGASMWLGPDYQFAAEIDVRHGSHNLIADALDILAPPSDSLLRLVPEGVMSVSCAGVDLEGLVAYAFDLIEITGNASDELKGMLDGLSLNLGFHPIDDVLEVLTGEFASFSRGLADLPDGIDVADLDEEELSDDTVLVGLADGELFLEYVESAIAQFGMEDGVTLEIIAGLETFVIEDPASPLYVAIADDYAIMADSAEPVREVVATLAGDAPAFLDDDRIEAQIEELTGSQGFTIGRTAAGLEMMLEVMQLVATSDEVDEGADEILAKVSDLLASDVISETFDGIAVYSMRVGSEVSTLRFESL